MARRGGILIPFLIVFVVLAFISPPFLRSQNLSNILDQQAGIIIVAVAGTLVLIAGGIDLSIGAVYGLAGATAAQLAVSFGPAVGILAALGVGLAIGLSNGVVVTKFRINPLIGTLAMSFVVSGIAAIATHGNLVVVLDHPEFQGFAATRWLGLTSAAWMMIAIAIAGAILLSRTTFGRYVYATGGNAEAARLGGVRIDTVRIATFALSGMAAALAGTIDASRTLSAQASAGSFLTFTVLTGIIVGGTSILGGEGSVPRTVVGCLFVALVANGFNLLGFDPFYQQVTLGVILLLAVGTDAWSRRLGIAGSAAWPVSIARGRLGSFATPFPTSATAPASPGRSSSARAGRRPHRDRDRLLPAGGWLSPRPFVRGVAVRPRRRAVLEIDGAVHRLVEGRFRADPDRRAHTLANGGESQVRWMSMNTPQRLAPDAGRKDTFFAKSPPDVAGLDARGRAAGVRRTAPALGRALRRNAPQAEALRLDEPARGRESAGMDTALVVYSGISVKMLVDRSWAPTC